MLVVGTTATSPLTLSASRKLLPALCWMTEGAHPPRRPVARQAGGPSIVPLNGGAKATKLDTSERYDGQKSSAHCVLRPPCECVTMPTLPVALLEWSDEIK